MNGGALAVGGGLPRSLFALSAGPPAVLNRAACDIHTDLVHDHVPHEHVPEGVDHARVGRVTDAPMRSQVRPYMLLGSNETALQRLKVRARRVCVTYRPIVHET